MCRRRCWTHRVRDHVREKRRFLIEAAEDQLTDHKTEVEVECGESQLVFDFLLKCCVQEHPDQFHDGWIKIQTWLTIFIEDSSQKDFKTQPNNLLNLLVNVARFVSDILFHEHSTKKVPS